MNKGLPQGGILSPTLYNIYTAEITKNIEKKIQVVQYADDTALYVTEKRSTKDCKKGIEKVVNEIEKRLSNLGLEIESSKTNIVIFNNKKDRENRLICRIKGDRIENVRAAKFLGIIIDSKLKFDRQIQHVQNKVNKTINVMRFLCTVRWVMEISTALMVYKSYVRSIIDYELFIYYPREGKGREKWKSCRTRE